MRAPGTPPSAPPDLLPMTATTTGGLGVTLPTTHLPPSRREDWSPSGQSSRDGGNASDALTADALIDSGNAHRARQDFGDAVVDRLLWTRSWVAC